MPWPASCPSGRRIGGHLHPEGQGDARHFEGHDPDEEVAALRHAYCGKAGVVTRNPTGIGIYELGARVGEKALEPLFQALFGRRHKIGAVLGLSIQWMLVAAVSPVDRGVYHWAGFYTACRAAGRKFRGATPLGQSGPLEYEHWWKAFVIRPSTGLFRLRITKTSRWRAQGRRCCKHARCWE